MKAKFKYKYIDKRTTRGTNPVHLFYEYRGREYMVTDMHNGIDNLAEQHKTEQNRIDFMLDSVSSQTGENAEIGLNMFFDYYE